MTRLAWRRTAIGVAVAGLTVVAVLFNKPASPAPPKTYRHGVVDRPGYSSNGTLEEPGNDDIAEVRRALAARARAVLSGDRAAFLQVVDTDRGRFLADQRTVWRNTQQLPFATLSYTYEGIVEPDDPLHTPSFLVRVATTYQLKGFDSSPLQVEDGFTFVRQGGAWKLAGVSDADGQFSQKALPVPWDGSAIDAYGDGDYLAVVDRGRLALAHHLVSLCHRAATASGDLLGVTDDRPTVVLATSGSRGFRSFTGPDAAAVAYPVTTADGRASGWRVKLNPGYVDRVVADPVVLTHELTHLAMQTYLPFLPTWLTEGSAEYVGWHSVGGLRSALVARGYHSRRTLPPRLPISAAYYLQGVQRNYLQGQALVTWIAEHRGSQALLTLFRDFTDAGAGRTSYDADVAQTRILHRVLGMTPQQLSRAAYAELVAQVSPA
ncbi:MAG TPA: hypothetical protein VFJ89_12300 [Nocardioides sp.]|nr:hypothetical protein [Nocardioides sp.]